MRLLLFCVFAIAASAEVTRLSSGYKWFEADHGSIRGPVAKAQHYLVDQDHFDGTNTNQWGQAYYVNDTFWKAGSDAPVFLCVGGEGPPLDGSAVQASVHCNDAVEFMEENNALMFALEHRYYGCHDMDACPVKDFSQSDSLKYLSSRQALGDIAAFHAYASEKYGLTSANKWVTFGGSYPGMLAGWARLRFPHLIHAAVSSSAPVLAQVDFIGYNDVVAYAYSVADNDVGGSKQCEDAIRSGHAQIGDLMGTDAGRQRLSKEFNVPASSLADPAFQRAFAGEGVADFPSQSNDPACDRPACNIKRICTIMTNTTLGDEVTRLANVRSTQSAWSSKASSLRTGLFRTRDSLPDFWLYQTCTEFAFYQTCEKGTDCFFTQGLSTLDVSFCKLFGVPEDKVYSNVDYSNEYYGGLTPAGSRVLYPNGEVDPWRSLGISKAPSADLPTLYVPGASHHAWTHPSMPSDQPSVVAAREAIWSQLRAWLRE